jgi:hypothetical protein
MRTLPSIPVVFTDLHLYFRECSATPTISLLRPLPASHYDPDGASIGATLYGQAKPQSFFGDEKLPRREDMANSF